MFIRCARSVGNVMWLSVLLVACAAPLPTPAATSSVHAGPAVARTADPAPAALPPTAPAPEPTRAPTVAPTEAPTPTAIPPSPTPPKVDVAPTKVATPERPAKMVEFAGYTASFEDGRWVQRNAKGELRTVWDGENGKWAIDASVKRLAIGTELEDAGMVTALPAAEIAELMKLPENQNKIPLPIGLGPKVMVSESASKSPVLNFDGLSGVSVYWVGGSSSEKAMSDAYVTYRLYSGDKSKRYSYFFPREYDGLVSSNTSFGGVAAVLNGGKIGSADVISEHQFALSGDWGGRARFEDMLTNSQGQMVAFLGK